ncbi:hypothetical protein B0O99DRAFT_267368 [Bisporella sp. PMI_857]|nr:hypothetical protein B0O99DRAFT_267368 [Bisporella sp. PMI_857]
MNTPCLDPRVRSFFTRWPRSEIFPRASTSLPSCQHTLPTFSPSDLSAGRRWCRVDISHERGRKRRLYGNPDWGGHRAVEQSNPLGKTPQKGQEIPSRHPQASSDTLTAERRFQCAACGRRFVPCFVFQFPSCVWDNGWCCGSGELCEKEKKKL